MNTLGNLNATDFQVTIPSANLSAVMSDSDTKLIQNPQIRALDGQKATLKIGDRVPVATGSFQPGIGGVGINPLVNTQFQYLDVGVNIDITPHVHAGREVTLKISMDISSVTGQSSIGGINQPIIGQRKIEHEIRLKDGEANLLGGMLEDQQTKSLSGIPGLAQIPILNYLFGQTTQDHSENEIVFRHCSAHYPRNRCKRDQPAGYRTLERQPTIELRHVRAVPASSARNAGAGHPVSGERGPALRRRRIRVRPGAGDATSGQRAAGRVSCLIRRRLRPPKAAPLS